MYALVYSDSSETQVTLFSNKQKCYYFIMEIIKAELEMLADKEKLNSYKLFSKSMETSDYDLIIQLFCELMSEANIYIDFEIVIPDIMLDS